MQCKKISVINKYSQPSWSINSCGTYVNPLDSRPGPQLACSPHNCRLIIDRMPTLHIEETIYFCRPMFTTNVMNDSVSDMEKTQWWFALKLLTGTSYKSLYCHRAAALVVLIQLMSSLYELWWRNIWRAWYNLNFLYFGIVVFPVMPQAVQFVDTTFSPTLAIS